MIQQIGMNKTGSAIHGAHIYADTKLISAPLCGIAMIVDGASFNPDQCWDSLTDIIDPVDGAWKLEAGVYQYNTTVYLEMSETAYAQPFEREELIHAGVFVHTRFFEPGFIGAVTGTIHLTQPTTLVENQEICDLIYHEN